MRLLVTAIVLVAALAGCGSQTGETIDGWPLGPAAKCSGDQATYCARPIAAAREELDRISPGHAPIVGVELFDEAKVDAQGSFVLVQSVPIDVARFQLADGSVRAIGVGDTPGGPYAEAHGP